MTKWYIEAFGESDDEMMDYVLVEGLTADEVREILALSPDVDPHARTHPLAPDALQTLATRANYSPLPGGTYFLSHQPDDTRI
jgi:molybdopterin-guanine dinucleotide biosynthesis protein